MSDTVLINPASGPAAYGFGSDAGTMAMLHTVDDSVTFDWPVIDATAEQTDDPASRAVALILRAARDAATPGT
jgi:hypothetical protein